MSVTNHYDCTINRAFEVLSSLGKNPVLSTDFLTGEKRLLWHEPKVEGQVGVFISQTKDILNVDKGHSVCINGQQILKDYLKSEGVPCSWTD